MSVATDSYEFDTLLNDGLYTKRILIEGDSWVSHPQLPNISDQLTYGDAEDVAVLNLASPGDEASAIFKSYGRQMKLLKETLNTERWGFKFDLIFLSAAGNDIIGPEIISKGYVKNKREHPYLYGRELICDHFYLMLSNIAKGYSRFLKMRDSSELNSSTPVLTHSYSYLQPRNVGTHIGPIKISGGWVKRHLSHLGIKDNDEQGEIINTMLDAFHDRVKEVEACSKNFVVLDLRRLLLKNGRPDVSLWHDEIHPNAKGFKKIGRYINKHLEKNYW